MTTFSTDETSNAEFDYAIVTLTEDRAKGIAKATSLFKSNKESHPELVEMYFRDLADCTFFSAQELAGDEAEVEDLLEAEEAEAFETKGWVELPENFEEPLEHMTGEVYLVVGNDYFYWHVLPDTSAIKIETQTIPFDVLNQIL